jgi:hypothetical protein
MIGSKSLALLLSLFLISLISAAPAQRRKRAAPKAAHPAPTPNAPDRPVETGPAVIITDREGNRIFGQLIELSQRGALIKAESTELNIPIEKIASISFEGSGRPNLSPDFGPDFGSDLSKAINAFQAMMAGLKPGTDYTEYSNLLVELRRQAERFIAKYGSSENPVEAQAAALAASALTDYNWARMIWTLKFGGGGTISETSAPVVADALQSYPEFKAGEKFSADKLIALLLGKAADKVARLRAVVGRAPR